MISRTFIREYLKVFFPNYDVRFLDLLEIISDFTDPYIEASNMAIIALDQNKRIVMVNQLAATLFNTSETSSSCLVLKFFMAEDTPVTLFLLRDIAVVIVK